MSSFAITLDAAVPSPKEPGFFHRYDSAGIARSFNAVADGVSNAAMWYDRASTTIMLKPEQLSHSFLNSSAQVPYIIRLSAFTANPTNISSVHLFEANLAQNPNNPFIHHTPLTPTLPTLWLNSPEQLPGLGQIENQAGDSASVAAFPGAFPGVAASDSSVICWTHDPLPWNMPLYLRWWVPPAQAGHIHFYEFYIGQFCIRCGPSVLEVFKDDSAAQDRSHWQTIARPELFGAGPVQTTGWFSNIINHVVTEHQGHLRGLLWLPYRRNYVYLESSYGKYGVFKANPTPRGNGESGAASDWAIVQKRNLVVAGLTPGPGFFQIQKVKFATGPGVFNLAPFTVDYAPTASPANDWLVDEKDTPEGSTITHTTPATPVPYTFYVNDIDHCTAVISDPASDQSRTYGSTYTLTPGADPTDAALKTYTPMLYGVEARIANANVAWPVTAVSFTDVSLAAPSARIKRATLSADLGHPGRFEAEIEDFQTSLAAYYSRSDFPLKFSDQNGQPGSPAAWTTLWLGVADPLETRELRLDTAAPRELRLPGSDFWKWLNEAPMRDNRDWTGVGHITVIQSVLQQAGVSIANWDGPSPGVLDSGGIFHLDASGYDDPLGGLRADDPTLADGTADPTQTQPVKPVWRPNQAPPDSYGSYIKRIAEIWSAWDHGFHPDGSFYYHPFDYYAASELLFRKDQTHAAPRYFRASVEYEPLFPDANVVAAVASTPGGSLVYSSFFVDFGSLYKQTAVNFIGKEKGLLIALPGWLPCDALNKCARSVFQRARRRRLRVHFHGSYVPALKIGHCHQLEGITGTWRLQSVMAAYERQGWDTARYVSELVEKGFD